MSLLHSSSAETPFLNSKYHLLVIDAHSSIESLGFQFNNEKILQCQVLVKNSLPIDNDLLISKFDPGQFY